MKNSFLIANPKQVIRGRVVKETDFEFCDCDMSSVFKTSGRLDNFGLITDPTARSFTLQNSFCTGSTPMKTGKVW